MRLCEKGGTENGDIEGGRKCRNGQESCPIQLPKLYGVACLKRIGEGGNRWYGNGSPKNFVNGGARTFGNVKGGKMSLWSHGREHSIGDGCCLVIDGS
jgi:hypothetical protein